MSCFTSVIGLTVCIMFGIAPNINANTYTARSVLECGKLCSSETNTKCDLFLYNSISKSCIVRLEKTHWKDKQYCSNPWQCWKAVNIGTVTRSSNGNPVNDPRRINYKKQNEIIAGKEEWQNNENSDEQTTLMFTKSVSADSVSMGTEKSLKCYYCRDDTYELCKQNAKIVSCLTENCYLVRTYSSSNFQSSAGCGEATEESNDDDQIYVSHCNADLCNM